MRGRTEDNIRKSIEKMHKIAEVIFRQELELIPSYVEHNPPKDCKEAVWFLGQSIQKLAGADYFIGTMCSNRYKGCNCEGDIAFSYDIKCHFIPCYKEIFPDMQEAVDLHFNRQEVLKNDIV